MTYTLHRYKSYQEYLEDEQLNPERNYRLLDTGEIVEASLEDEQNIWLTMVLVEALLKAEGLSLNQAD